MTVGPQLFLLGAYAVEGAGPSATGTPLLLLRILVSGIGVALFYTALAMAVSSLTTRRAVAAVAIVLVLLVPSIAVARRGRERRRPRRARACSLRSSVATEFAWRVFGETASDRRRRPPITHVSTGLVVAGLAGWIVLGAAVCLVSYRRQAGRR